MTKKELRAAMKKRNLSLTCEERIAASECIFGRIERLPDFQTARCVALFCALPDEPSTDEFLKRWCVTKQIVVPRVEGETIAFYQYDPDSLDTGAFGIAEPTVAGRECDPVQIDLIIVPGTAFTAAGGRMGRGRGYYDKYLSQPGFQAVKIGVCYSHQLVAVLPVEPHDVEMNYIMIND